jgi:hypothetical protein
MSIILAGSGNNVIFAAPGRPMLVRPLAISGDGGAPPSLTAISGLAGWWDAGAVAGIGDPSGALISGFGASVGGVVDKSGAGAALNVFHQASSGTTAPVATGRLNGLLGGIGRNTVVPPLVPVSPQQLPVMDADQGLGTAAMTIGSGAPWTVFLVWSRPNWKQASNAPSPLLSVNGVVILAADNKTGVGHLTLFPGAAPIVLTAALTRRHSHAVVLRNTPGGGVDAWLDGVQVATAAANPLTSSLNAPLLFLHGGASGGAECWFHEAAIWQRALTGPEITAVAAYQARWRTGPRKGVQILVTGQSNAGNGLNDGAWHLLAQGVAWHLGALAYGVVGNYGSPPAATCIHGEGIYPVPALGLIGSFLNNPNDGSDPSTWVTGVDGQAVQTWLQTVTDPTDAADIVAILWPWSEDDSTRAYSEKATFEGAARRLLALERGMLLRSAGSLPQLWWSALPFDYGNNGPGMQMHREVVADMAADATQNVWVVLPQTADSLPRGAASYDPVTGLWTGGDWLHRDAIDNLRFGRLAAPLVARAVLASGGGDILTTIPAGIPSAGGPEVTHVWRQTATSLIITVRHDGGTDLVMPTTQADLGVGWGVMDGGTVASPGAIVTATACARINATQLLITLTRPLANASANCRLFYPYGPATIGRGNVVTDNFSAVTSPAGWNIAADLGSDWALNMPVHVPMTIASGVVLSDTP